MMLHIRLDYHPAPEIDLPDVLFRVKHDIERPEGVRSIPLSTLMYRVAVRKIGFADAWVLWRYNVPEVFLMEPIHMVKLDYDWQIMMWELFLYGAPNLSVDYAVKKWTEVMGCHRAFTNNHGFECKKIPAHGPFANYIMGDSLGKELPRLDKPRVCGGATISGRVSGGYLYVDTLTEPKPIEQLVKEPWHYFHAVTVHKDGTIGKFPQGDGSPVLFPLVATEEVRIPLSDLERVSAIADPYWIP